MFLSQKFKFLQWSTVSGATLSQIDDLKTETDGVIQYELSSVWKTARANKLFNFAMNSDSTGTPKCEKETSTGNRINRIR